MRLNLFACCLSLLGTAAFAQNNEWRDPNVNQINRAPMHTNYFAYPNEDSALKGCKESVENYMSLNGTWKFFWVKNADMREEQRRRAEEQRRRDERQREMRNRSRNGYCR